MPTIMHDGATSAKLLDAGDTPLAWAGVPSLTVP
jgi:hypothetical protein